MSILSAYLLHNVNFVPPSNSLYIYTSHLELLEEFQLNLLHDSIYKYAQHLLNMNELNYTENVT
jgi:hypothetical protein